MELRDFLTFIFFEFSRMAKDESEARKVEKGFMLKNLSTAKQSAAVIPATDVLRGRSRKGDKSRNVPNEGKTVPNANDTL